MTATSKSISFIGPKMYLNGAHFNLYSRAVDRKGDPADYARMNEVIFPRSPRETMDGWPHLPRFVDKIRLHLAGKLHPDYQENFTKGFDGAWLKAAGVTPEQMIEVVKHSVCDGEVADWVAKHVKKSDAEKAAFRDFVLNRGTE